MNILGMIMAGGEGSRLYPLTMDRAKPAVPFGGKYRLVDFVLSNLINSGIYSIYVLTQFKAQSLLQHLRDGWQFANLLKDQFIIPVPAQMVGPVQVHAAIEIAVRYVFAHGRIGWHKGGAARNRPQAGARDVDVVPQISGAARL